MISKLAVVLPTSYFQYIPTIMSEGNCFLLPEILKRIQPCSQKKVKEVSLGQVEIVLAAKKENLSKLKAQYRLLLSHNSKKKLEIKSKHIRRIDLTKGFSQKMNIEMKYHQSCKEMENYYSLRIEEFETKMKELDLKFTSSLEKYDDLKLNKLITTISEDISVAKQSIDLGKTDLMNDEEWPLKLLRQVIPKEPVEDEYEKINKRCETLHELATALENELTAVNQQSSYFNKFC